LGEARPLPRRRGGGAQDLGVSGEIADLQNGPPDFVHPVNRLVVPQVFRRRYRHEAAKQGTGTGAARPCLAIRALLEPAAVGAVDESEPQIFHELSLSINSHDVVGVAGNAPDRGGPAIASQRERRRNSRCAD
jgi:hypothetical protein